MASIRYPENADLLSLVRFSAQDGCIWLADNRMVLLHADALASLRRELVTTCGADVARYVLERMGYAAGLRDAELAKQVRGSTSLMDAFLTGPQLHMLEGKVNVRPVHVDIDLESGRFECEFMWYDSLEAETFVREWGRSPAPACWMQLGYASGYASGFMGRHILFREVECIACGAADGCRIQGRPADAWPQTGDVMERWDGPPSFVERPQVSLRSDSRGGGQPDSADQGPALLGSASCFRRAVELAATAASTDVSVLLLGETGVGKERFARKIHAWSPRSSQPFVAVNCAALPTDLLEAELFGVEKGAYTGAHVARAGRFERAHGGTLFLDEVGELPLAAQAKLLRVLQEGEVERVGSECVRQVDVRLVAATNRDLQQAVKAGRFRADLYYRLNVYPVSIPPLRKRKGDIPELAAAMMVRFARQHGRSLRGFTERAERALQHYDWPGNLRELENLIERGVIRAVRCDYVGHEHMFCDEQLPEPVAVGLDRAGAIVSQSEQARRAICSHILEAGIPLDDLEDSLFALAVDQAGGNLASAARTLGVTRAQVSYRLKKRRAERRTETAGGSGLGQEGEQDRELPHPQALDE